MRTFCTLLVVCFAVTLAQAQTKTFDYTLIGLPKWTTADNIEQAMKYSGGVKSGANVYTIKSRLQGDMRYIFTNPEYVAVRYTTQTPDEVQERLLKRYGQPDEEYLQGGAPVLVWNKPTGRLTLTLMTIGSFLVLDAHGEVIQQ
jgi:hypothetical protein